MEITTFFFSDHLFAKLWVPEGAPKGIFQIAHGVAEHCLRYDELAEFLCDEGWVVVAHDHRGHGQSLGAGEPRHYFEDWFQVVADIHTLGELVREQFPNCPSYLLGHSMGSFLARTYLIHYPDTLAGCILMGTGTQPSALIAGGRMMCALRSVFKGATSPSRMVDGLAFAPYNRAFAPNRTPLDWLSVNPANVDAYIADPDCGGFPTPGLFSQMLRGIRFIQDPKHLAKMRKSTPILFLSGGQDPVGDFGKGVQKAEQAFVNAGMASVQSMIYGDLRHEILQEFCAPQIHHDILHWLTEREGTVAP